jgi:hypothetical protein
MGKVSRHHHYLSQFYLRGFTKDGTIRSKLVVIDFKEKKSYPTSTRNVGGIRDFNTINIEGVEPDKLENDLSVFEGKVAQALKKIEVSLSFKDETKDIILNYLAFLAIRVPKMREHWRKTQAQIAENIMGQILATKERWESQMAQIKRDEIEEEITYEEAKEFFDNKNYTIEVPREYHISLELEGINAILPLLFARKWILIKSTNFTGPFITSDYPVVLTWNEPDKIPPIYRYQPGYGCSGTTVYFPLSRNLSLVGEFDGREGVIEGNRLLVANLNTRMLLFKDKQIYSPTLRFYYGGEGVQIFDGNQILKGFNAKTETSQSSNET